MATEEPLPRGVGKIPHWWMEITPHEVLNFEDEETKRHAAEEEALMLARAAALEDMKQKYGGEGFPDWDPANHGPRTPEEEEEWSKKGWKRLSNDQWVDENTKPLDGRQFKGVLPPGYRPGQFGAPGGSSSGGYYNPSRFGGTGGGGGGGGGGAARSGGAGFGQGNLTPSGGKYGRDEGKNWQQPTWTKLKLRSTDTGKKLREGDNSKGGAAAAAAAATPEPAAAVEAEAPSELKRVKRISRTRRVSKTAPAANEETEEVVEETEYEEEVIEEEVVEEEYEEEIIEEIIVEDEDGNEIVQDGPTTDVTELQNIFARRANEQQLL